MPEGKSITVSKGEYPELEGMNGKMVTFSGEASVTEEGDNVILEFSSFNMDTENQADKALREMTGKDQRKDAYREPKGGRF